MLVLGISMYLCLEMRDIFGTDSFLRSLLRQHCLLVSVANIVGVLSHVRKRNSYHRVKDYSHSLVERAGAQDFLAFFFFYIAFFNNNEMSSQSTTTSYFSSFLLINMVQLDSVLTGTQMLPLKNRYWTVWLMKAASLCWYRLCLICSEFKAGEWQSFHTESSYRTMFSGVFWTQSC